VAAVADGGDTQTSITGIPTACTYPRLQPMPLISIAVGIGMIVAAHLVARWVLHLNAFRMVSAVGAAHAGDDAATSRPIRLATRIDFLNPTTWEPSTRDPAAAERERARRDEVMKQIGFVEISAVVWKWSTVAIGGFVILLGAATRVRPRWHRGPLWATAPLILVAAAYTLAGMHALIAYGGFPPQPLLHYVLVGIVASTYGWILLVYLVWTRRRLVPG
jgi:hypothetical protein